MPIPLDARQVAGQPNRVQLNDGQIVTRHQALNLGAQYMGYTNHNDYRKHSETDTKYVDAWLKSRQGKEAMELEKRIAKAEGRRFNRAQFKQRVVASRNARPHPKTNKPGGPAFQDFMTRYGFTGGVDYVKY